MLPIFATLVNSTKTALFAAAKLTFFHVMTEMETESKMHPLTMAILTIVVSTFGFVLIGPIIGFFLAIPFFEGNPLDQLRLMADPANHPELRLPLYIMQGSATFCCPGDHNHFYGGQLRIHLLERQFSFSRIS
ncbi:MAG: hypothetical protein HYR67_00285 [Bacteroidetes bacterium]|nr:hypothetical protein [Bacteroidota bacterium]